MNHTSDPEAQRLRDIGKRLPSEVAAALREAHNALPESYHFGCVAHYEGTWCCLDHLLDTDREST